MRLSHNLHLAYCTNIHRGESWPQSFEALKQYTLAVRERVAPNRPYAIGLRLGDLASRELLDKGTILGFQRWLDEQNCYVFTINGFPYGQFHGTRVKEQVYAPDWTSPERLEYTQRLFDILAQLVPSGCEGSISTLPGSFKEFITSQEQVVQMRENLWRCVDYIAALSERTGKTLHLGLEPEPLCYLESTSETVRFFEEMRTDRPGDERLGRHLGVNYDCCHLAVEFEEPGESMQSLCDNGVKISKIHLSSALKVQPTEKVRQALSSYADETYLHQVIQRGPEGNLTRFKDLPDALAGKDFNGEGEAEWRIHFHVPLHSEPGPLFGNTSDHLLGVMDFLQGNPRVCSHLEMETYTWEVMPPEMRNRSVVEQLVAEYKWTLGHFAERGLVETE